MANENRGIHTYTVQEATNIALPRMIKINPTQVVADADDNDVIFNWTELSNASLTNGRATKLISVGILDSDDSVADIELVFCRGEGDAGTAPTVAQALGTANDVVDITADQTLEVEICGSVPITRSEGDLLTALVITKTNINLIMQPQKNSTSLYVAGIWRGADPVVTGSATSMNLYFGFEG
jgi:hypothetical protein